MNKLLTLIRVLKWSLSYSWASLQEQGLLMEIITQSAQMYALLGVLQALSAVSSFPKHFCLMKILTSKLFHYN